MKIFVNCIFSLGTFFSFFYLAGSGWAPHLTRAFPGFATIGSSEFYFLIILSFANAVLVAPIITAFWNMISPIKTANMFEAILAQIFSLTTLSVAAFYVLYSSDFDQLIEFVRLFIALESISISAGVVIEYLAGEQEQADSAPQSNGSVISTTEPTFEIRNALSYVIAAFAFSAANCLLIVAILLIRGLGPASLVGWDNVMECALFTCLATSICGPMFFAMGRSLLGGSRAAFSSERLFEGTAYTIGSILFLVALTIVVCFFAVGTGSFWPLVAAGILMIGSCVIAGAAFAFTRDNSAPPAVSTDRYKRLYG